MNNLHVQLNYEDSLNARRNSLLIQENLLKSLVHLEQYNKLRKIEFSFKNKIRKDFFELTNLLISLQEQFPKQEVILAENLSKKTQRKTSIIPSLSRVEKIKKEPVQKKNKVEEELEDIRRRLAQLS